MGFAFIIPKYLAQGSVPLDYDLRGRFDTVVLCAEALQDVPTTDVVAPAETGSDSGTAENTESTES